MRHILLYMDLDAYAVKSYNAMQASIAINAIDSEREGLVRVWLYICTFKGLPLPPQGENFQICLAFLKR
jgi:hypothetical protein